MTRKKESWLDQSLTRTYRLISDDILKVLHKSDMALSVDQLYEKRCLPNYSWDGWVFAIEKLVTEKKVIEVFGDDGTIYYALPTGSKIFITQ